MSKQAQIRIIGEPLIVEAITRDIRRDYTVLEETDRKSFENPEHIRRYLQVEAPEVVKMRAPGETKEATE